MRSAKRSMPTKKTASNSHALNVLHIEDAHLARVWGKRSAVAKLIAIDAQLVKVSKD
jgi:hypothetical protein